MGHVILWVGVPHGKQITALKQMAYHINNSDFGHMHLKQQLDKSFKINFATPSENAVEKKKEGEQEVGDNLSV